MKVKLIETVLTELAAHALCGALRDRFPNASIAVQDLYPSHPDGWAVVCDHDLYTQGMAIFLEGWESGRRFERVSTIKSTQRKPMFSSVSSESSVVNQNSDPVQPCETSSLESQITACLTDYRDRLGIADDEGDRIAQEIAAEIVDLLIPSVSSESSVVNPSRILRQQLELAHRAFPQIDDITELQSIALALARPLGIDNDQALQIVDGYLLDIDARNRGIHPISAMVMDERPFPPAP